MSKILDGMVKLVSDKITPYRAKCNNVYFRRYIASIEGKRDKFLTYIDSNFDKIHRNFISDSVAVACEHISMETTYTHSDMENYIIYLLVCHLNDQYYNHHYQQSGATLYVHGKAAPDTYTGVVVTQNERLPVFLKPKDTDLAYVNEINSAVTSIIAKDYPMPFVFQSDAFVGVERCQGLTRDDPYLEVIKDVANQMKCLKDYRFSHLSIDDIGRSNYGLRRYFIHNFDAIAPTDGCFRTHLINMISLLCDFFIDSEYPRGKFKEYIRFLLTQPDDDTIYDRFIIYLIIK